MDKIELFTNLRDIFAYLYNDEASARRAVADASLNTTRIAFSAHAINNWYAILSEAEKTGQIEALLTVALKEYGSNQKLQAVYTAFRSTFSTSQSSVNFDWVHIPAGEFLMGRDPSAEYSPQHTVYLPEYYIARVSVTNTQYKIFLEANKYRPPKHWVDGCIPDGKENHPVVNVNWHHAQAFCHWAGVRLPTEAEWEKAARGTDGRKYPWGNEPPSDQLCNFSGSQIKDTTPVGSYPNGASPYGVLDMSGNVWEWASSLWGPEVERPKYHYPYDAIDGREDKNASGRRIIRGGSFNPSEGNPHCAFRGYPNPDTVEDFIGFRVVRLGK